jgi:TolB protein
VRKALLIAVTIAIGSIGLASCGSSTVKFLGANKQGAPNQIPWDSVGPRWALAIFSSSPAGAKNQATPQLFLVNPQGGRYLIASYPGQSVSLLGWSTSNREALVSTIQNAAGGGGAVQIFNLNTGNRTHNWTQLPNTNIDASSMQFANPKAGNLLGNTTSQTKPYCLLSSYTLTGTRLMSFPNSFPEVGAYECHFVQSNNGQTIAVDADKGIALMNSSGGVTQQFAVPAKYTSCLPVKYWTSTTLLLTCGNTDGAQNQLLTMSTVTGALTALANAPTGQDLGDINAWTLKGGALYGQSVGPCGYEFLSKRDANNNMVQVNPPNTNNQSVFVEGATSTELLLHATLSCGNGESLFWFNPVKNTETVVLGPPLNPGGVIDVFAYPTIR